jgi:hypothetical protein
VAGDGEPDAALPPARHPAHTDVQHQSVSVSQEMTGYCCSIKSRNG